ncbi:bacillithiol biosynthesis deacetylase BshB1 [Bacillota bacterium LX-D]|nr:bacillithiol biosynthesis deacetylase BshB1 [Bacillota bacterium LX-D]
MLEKLEKADLIAFGAHPDDVEIGCGGLIALTAKKRSVGIVDLTKGEMASTGTVEERAKEASEAARILNVKWRVNLGIPDRGVSINEQNIAEIVKVIRQSKPRIVLVPFPEDRHPDHVNCSKLVAQAVFSAGLWKVMPDLEPHRTKHIFHYFLNNFFAEPSFVVDISAAFQQKVAAVQAHHSQFDPDRLRPTSLNTGGFTETLEARNRFFGSLIKATYGEPYYSKEMLSIGDLFAL